MIRGTELTVTIDKADLLDRLKKNREKHAQEYQTAFEGYVLVVTQELEEKLAKIKAGEAVETYSVHTAPVDHTSEYDDLIDMLEMADDKQMELTQQQFRQYARDDWGWKQTWATENMTYTAAAVGRPGHARS
jgi:hypothetical protein